MSSPQEWKSEQAREFVRSAGVHEDGIVCRPCRKDVSRVVADPSYLPIGGTKPKSNCCVQDCSEQVYACSRMARNDRITAIL